MKMTNKLAVLLVAAFAAARGFSAPRVPQNHVPAVLGKDVRPIYPEAAKRANIALLNAPGAIPAAEWPLVSTYAASRLTLNIWTNETDKTVIRVYFLRGEPKEGILAAPGKWAKVDVAMVESDNPDVKTLRDRRAKLILRALAFACGGGQTMEPVCSMFYGAQSLKGMDRTNITLSPMCYFPMSEFLNRLDDSGELTTFAEPDGE